MNMDQNSSEGFGKLGLVCHYQFENGSSQFAFLDVKNGDGGAALDRSLGFSTESFVQVLATSGDFILLSSHNGDQISYNVFNSVTKEEPFPVPNSPCIVGRVVGAGLASTDEYDSQFEVVLVEENYSEPNGLVLHIFSSYTYEWRTHKPANLSAPTLLASQEISAAPLYSNGAIHWKISGHLLVYHVKGKHCELFELPNSSGDSSRGCLCESRGYVYYCYSDFDGFHVWGLIKKDDRYGSLYAGFDIDLGRFRWRLVHSLGSEDFSSQYLHFCGRFFDWEPYKVTPIAYAEQGKIIYLQLPGTVVSYSFDGGVLRSVCRYSYPGTNFNCCSFLPSIRLCNQPKEKKLLGSAGMELTLPIAEAEKLCF